jgi:ElaB/YqjD/DUF883 family membrane-anchored ribosome-binding protein
LGEGEIGMNSDELEGKLNGELGRLQAAAGRALDDPQMEAEGEARQIVGAVEETVGKAKETVKRTAQRAQAVLADATDQASETYEAVRERAQAVVDTVDPFVKEQPYAAVALAAIVGLIVGALFFSGGARVVYIKPARE